MSGARWLRRHLLLAAGALPWAAGAAPVLRVGPTRPIKSLAAAARQARDGDVIEVDAGDYTADVAAWPQHDLTLRAVGGRVRVIGAGAQVQGKGLFVTSGRRQRIEGFDFSGATVPERNGAGIRLEAGSLTLVDCSFRDNQNGLLSANEGSIELDIIDCDFGPILPGEGRTHNLYVGAIKRLAVSGSWFHHGFKGHLLKSRAALNHILYNRLTDEIGGRASYELEFANGGVAVVMGNLIAQSSTTENPHVISFGAEGAARRSRRFISSTTPWWTSGPAAASGCACHRPRPRWCWPTTCSSAGRSSRPTATGCGAPTLRPTGTSSCSPRATTSG